MIFKYKSYRSTFWTIFFHIYVTPYIFRFQEICSIDTYAINFPHMLYLWQKYRHNRYILRLIIYLRLWAMNLSNITNQNFSESHVYSSIYSFVRYRTMSQSVILILLLWKSNIVCFLTWICGEPVLETNQEGSLAAVCTEEHFSKFWNLQYLKIG